MFRPRAMAMPFCALWTVTAALPARSEPDPASTVSPLTVTAEKGPFPVAPTRDAIFVRGKINGFADAGAAGPFYPDRAYRMGINGVALLRCTLAASGALSGCEIQGETPTTQGFGDAALKMAEVGAITAQPRIVEGQTVASELVLVLVPFQLTPNR